MEGTGERGEGLWDPGTLIASLECSGGITAEVSMSCASFAAEVYRVPLLPSGSFSSKHLPLPWRVKIKDISQN